MSHYDNTSYQLRLHIDTLPFSADPEPRHTGRTRRGLLTGHAQPKAITPFSDIE